MGTGKLPPDPRANLTDQAFCRAPANLPFTTLVCPLKHCIELCVLQFKVGGDSGYKLLEVENGYCNVIA